MAGSPSRKFGLLSESDAGGVNGQFARKSTLEFPEPLSWRLSVCAMPSVFRIQAQKRRFDVDDDESGSLYI
jgi:hypothetical protein